MSIDKDPAFHNVLVGAVVGLVSLLNTIGVMVLSRILKTQETIFGRLNKTDEKLTDLRARCEERHRRHDERPD